MPELIQVEALPDAASTSNRAQHLGPFTVYFPSGFRPGIDAPCRWQVFSHQQKKGHQIVVARTDSVDFVGSTQNAEYTGLQPCRYAMGILDKASGVMKYTEIQAGRIIRMEPQTHGIDYRASQDGAAKEEQDRESRMVNNKRLVELFGSTRRKRQMTSKESLVVKADAVGGSEAVKDMLTEAGAKATEANMTKEEVLALATAYRNIPPHHPEAFTAQDAYRLKELIPASCWHSLQISQFQKAVEDADARKELAEPHGVVPMPAYVLERLAGLKLTSDKKLVQRRLRCLAFLAALMKVYSGPPTKRADQARGGMTALASYYNVEVDVLEALLELFYHHRTEGTVNFYERSKEKGGLMLLYILIVALLAEDDDMPASHFDELRDHLKLGRVDMATKFRELGCITTAAAGGTPGPKPYKVQLLPPQIQPPKPLSEYFPKLKVGRVSGRK
ncbi:hypothetical protein WJX72_006510 [[Myrmecia] bisecta]|uniref:Uncharacterized protein n=1 Tax=[Myrmecia] bisecta TaxID=41462 RepID=A0AAW1PK02_9CHLO